MPAPSGIVGFVGPSTFPSGTTPSFPTSGSGGGVGAFVEAENEGVSIAFSSPALTDEPAWSPLPGVARYEIHRGRANELDKTGTGTATVTIHDTSGFYDISSGSQNFNPLKPAIINLRNPVTDDVSPIFRGHVARWQYDLYPTENYGVATLSLVDGMEILSSAQMIPGQHGHVSGDGTGDVIFSDDTSGSAVANRINMVLDDIGWPAGMREVFSGNIKLRQTVFAPRSPALSAIESATNAEFPGIANFYMQKNGFATFHGRLARFNPADVQYHIRVWRAGDMAGVAADSTRALIFGLDYDRDKDRLINSAYAAPQGIEDSDIEGQYVEDSTSTGNFGTRSWSADNLATRGDHFDGSGELAATEKFATYYVNNYKNPRTRVNRITFKTVAPGDANAENLWALICGVDISDIIRLKTTHLNGGFDEDFYVEGLHYTVAPATSEYLDVRLDLDVSPRAYWTSNPGF